MARQHFFHDRQPFAGRPHDVVPTCAMNVNVNEPRRQNGVPEIDDARFPGNCVTRPCSNLAYKTVFDEHDRMVNALNRTKQRSGSYGNHVEKSNYSKWKEALARYMGTWRWSRPP